MIEIIEIVNLKTNEKYPIQVITKWQYDEEMFRHDNNKKSLYLKAYTSWLPERCSYIELPKKLFRNKQRASDTNKFHDFVGFITERICLLNNTNEIKIVWKIDEKTDFCDFLEKYYWERKR